MRVTRKTAKPVILMTSLVAVIFTGCGHNDGPSDYERMVQAKRDAADSLAGAGAKVHEKQYPIGKGWVVELRGATVTDGLLKQVKQLGNIAELDLSRSTLTDEHIAVMREIDLQVVLTRLDLSDTGLTDAGLAKLTGCIFLSELNLTGTKVTPAAVAKFKKDRQTDPKAKIKNTQVRL